ncbi:MAG: Slp family lipoprotein [Gammaproteobacteria bacterium]|nr:Slp family lipoprotein [Gammaproteobacteria bacterium]MCW9004813.1 Slp family lipoprotein [Gammaproteobacteria bacterium]MCW9055839.1 Slp family lipoprotein [Gammaproteobacteria bacterium]
MLSRLLLITLLTLLNGCASSPKFDTREVDFSLTPISVIAEQENSPGKHVLWGGVILATKNLKTSTQIEVLAYPLDSYHTPQKDQKPLGRFIIHHPGYLEPTLYTQGKIVTVRGDIRKIEKGKVGESEYSYPVIYAQQLHLWSGDSNRVKTRLHIGIGIGL